MSFELTATTTAGARLVELAEELAADAAQRAAAHDREGTFPFASLAAVRRSGYLTGPIPEKLGGFGVASVHDLLVASSRLARGDASLTLGVNMHLTYVINVVRRYRRAVVAGDQRRSGPLAGSLEQLTRD